MVCATFFLGQRVFSADINTAQNINIVNQTISENFYTAGGSVMLNNIFEKDVFVVGGKAEIGGTIAGDLFVIGGEIDITGKILGDVRVIGGEVTMKGEVSGDLVLVGTAITIAPESRVNGESIFVGAQLTQESILKQKTKILAGTVYLNNEVAGEAGVTTQKITFGDHAKISGNFRYYAPDKAEKIDGAETTGTIIFNEIKSIRETGVVKSTILNLLSFWIILKFITTLIVAFALVYIFKVFAQGVTNLAIDSFVKNLLAGSIALVFVPVLVAILFVSLVAMPIGFLIFLVYIFMLIISPALASIVIGSLVGKMFEKEGEVGHYISFRTVAIGVILFTVLQFVPYLGGLTRLIFTLVAIGAICRYTQNAIVK